MHKNDSSLSDRLGFLSKLTFELKRRRFSQIYTGINPRFLEVVDFCNPNMPQQVAGDRIRIGLLGDDFIVGIVLDEKRENLQDRIEFLCSRGFVLTKCYPEMVSRKVDVLRTDIVELIIEISKAYHEIH